MNVLITGATGGIGKKLLKNLIEEKKYRLFILSRNLRKESVGEDYETRIGDLLDKNSLVGASKNIDLVIHLAGLTHSFILRKYFDINFIGTKNLLFACGQNKVKKFIFLSSRTASSDGGAYAESKLLAEEAVKKSNIDWVILSLAEVYGAGEEEAISSLIKQIKKQFLVFVPGDGSYELCPVFVDDVVSAIKKVIELRIKNKKYLIAGPESFSYNKFVDYLSVVFDKNIKKLFLPLFILKIIALIFPQFIVKDQIKRLVVKKSSDISLAEKELDFHPLDVASGLKHLKI